MKGGFIDYATPTIVFVYVYVLPSLLTFFLLVAIRINYFRLVFFNKTCIEYYLFSGRKLEKSSLTKYHGGTKGNIFGPQRLLQWKET